MPSESFSTCLLVDFIHGQLLTLTSQHDELSCLARSGVSVSLLGRVLFELILCSMFNSPFLSDVKIRQTYYGATKECYAHKAVLCIHSKWFQKAFAGSFMVVQQAMIV
jgi:hypothetical protein